MRIEIKQFSLLNILIALLLVVFALVIMDQRRAQRQAHQRVPQRVKPHRTAQTTRTAPTPDPQAEHYTFRQRKADRTDRTTRTVDMQIEDMNRQAAEAGRKGYERAKVEFAR